MTYIVERHTHTHTQKFLTVKYRESEFIMEKFIKEYFVLWSAYIGWHTAQ